MKTFTNLLLLYIMLYMLRVYDKNKYTLLTTKIVGCLKYNPTKKSLITGSYFAILPFNSITLLLKGHLTSFELIYSILLHEFHLLMHDVPELTMEA